MLRRLIARRWLWIAPFCFAILPVAPSPAWSAEPAASEPPTPEPPAFSESISVDLVSVPFYAIDAKGDPVYDLRPEEVELSIDGRSVTFDSFDRYGAAEPLRLPSAEAAAAVGEPAPERLLPPSRPRHVFLLFDLAFSTPRGLLSAKEAADKLLADLPASDWIYLLTFHSQTGFEQKLGPAPANAEGKAKARELVAELRPNVERLRYREDLQPIASGGRASAPASDNVADAYRDMHGMDQSAYAAEARSLAESIESLAGFLRQLKGPRLVLLFSQGPDSTLYMEGTENRTNPIRLRYEPAMKALAESGAMPVFVNAAVNDNADIQEDTEFTVDADATFINGLPRGETALQHMATTSGGIVVAHSNPKILEQRISDWTSAYYELAYYPPPGAAVGGVPTIRVKRPGVQIWTSKSHHGRREFRTLTAREKRFVIADLVLRGPAGAASADIAAPRFSRLEGKFEGDPTAAGARHLSFEPAWPAELSLKSLELYSVVLEMGEKLEDTKLGKLDAFSFTPTGTSAKVATDLAAGADVVWGIVAVDPDSGGIYLRRLRAQPGAKAASTEAAAANSGER